ncbi:MAG: Ig-like domain-containing protein, partial [Clostridia bacterium]|nr:Ig-like domain-containing protein [Clostridia bacterium]
MSRLKVRYVLLFCMVALLLLITNYTYATEKILLGDINRDGKVDSIDMLYLMRHIVAENSEDHKQWILDYNRTVLADTTQNGKVNSSDLLVVLRYIAASNNPEEIGIKHKDWLELKEAEIGELEEKNNENDTMENEIINNQAKVVNEIEINNITETVSETIETNTKEEPEIVNHKIEEPKVEVRALKLNKSLIDIEKGKSEQIIATIEPQELSNEKIEWKVVNPQVAEVDETGKITGKKNGETILIARTSNGKEATSKVRVGTYPKAIVINKEEVK